MKTLTLIKLLLLQLVSTACFAQVYEKGYVVNNTNDTLKGLILVSKEMTSVSLSQGKEVTYSPADIKSIKLESGSYFISHDSVDNARVFLEVLLSGKVSLYKFRERFFAKSTSDNKLYELTQKTTTKVVNGTEMISISKPYLGILSFMLMDCPKTNQARIKRTSLNEVDLTRLIKEYYSCTNEEVVDYKVGKKNIAVDWGIILAPGFSKFKLNGAQVPINVTGKETWDSKPFLAGGLALEIYSERTGSKLRYRQEIVFVQQKRHGERLKYSNMYYEDNVYIDMTSNLIQGNFLLSYKYLNKQKFSSYVFIGPTLNYILNYEDSKVFTHKNFEAGPYTTEKTENFLEPKEKMYFGGRVGVGFEMPLKDKFKMQVDARVGFLTGGYRDVEFNTDDLYHDEIVFQLGVTLLKI